MPDDSLAHLLTDIGRAIREGRIANRWSQRGLARHAGVSQNEISRIESGAWSGLRVAIVDRLCVALGIQYSIVWTLPRTIPRQRDVVHAWCSAYAARRLGRAGWIVEREVEVGGDRSRGWADVVAFHPDSHVLLIVEIKTEIRDVGEVERQLGWYERESAAIARRRGWVVAAVRSALIVLESEANDAVIRRSADVFRVAFPGRARELRALVEGELGGPAGRSLALVDPRSRRRAWLRATRVDGRRTGAAYRDYADAARLLESRSAGPLGPTRLRDGRPAPAARRADRRARSDRHE